MKGIEKQVFYMELRNIVSILMESTFYFDLPLEERYELVKHILYSSESTSLK